MQHKKLNTSKGVIRSRELALVIAEEMPAVLRKWEVTNIRKISFRKGKEQIQANTYILTLFQPHNPKEVKIDYYLKRVEKYVPAPMRYFKYQKYGHHREACKG